jgi:hypothetical protein
MFAGHPEDKKASQMVLAFFGHHIDDPDVLEVWKEKAKQRKKPGIMGSFIMFFTMINMLLFGPKNLMKTRKEFMEIRKYDLVQKLKVYSNAKQIFYNFINGSQSNDEAFKNHG